MKPDSERKKRYGAKRHQAAAYLHAHVSKTLAKKMTSRHRAVRVHKGDKVKVMRGDNKGKEAKIARVDYQTQRIYLEGITRNNARGREIAVPFEPSNILLMELQSTPERKELLGEGAVVAPAAKKPAEKETGKSVPGKEEKKAPETEKKAAASKESTAAKTAIGKPATPAETVKGE